VSPLESLFRLEIEFHRCLRTLPTCPYDIGGLHTSYALQAGYEPLIFALGRINATDVAQLQTRLLTTADTRDVLAASDSLKQLLGIPQTGGIIPPGPTPRIDQTPRSDSESKR
jgi:hypothetical protein